MVKPTLRRRIHGLMFKLPGMISCEEFENFVMAYLDGELSSSKKHIFEMHMKICRECRDYLAAYQNALDLVRNLAPEEHEILADVPEDLVTAILDANGK